MNDEAALLAITLARVAPELGIATRLCWALRELTGADGASMSVTTTTDLGRLVLARTGGLRTGHLEAIEDLLGTGPAHDATRDQIIVVVYPGRGSAPWSTMVDPGIRVWAVPMRVDGRGTGAVLLHGDKPLSANLTVIQGLVDAATTTLLHNGFEDAVRAASRDHMVINLAIGIVAATHSLTMRDALALLRATALTQGTTLAQTASRTVRDAEGS